MNRVGKGKILAVAVWALGFFACTTYNTAHSRSEHGHLSHYHDGGRYHGHGGGAWGGYYGGGYSNERGWGGWAGPNIIINVPAPRYYARVPVCQTMEVCDRYGECWLEDYCQ